MYYEYNVSSIKFICALGILALAFYFYYVIFRNNLQTCYEIFFGKAYLLSLFALTTGWQPSLNSTSLISWLYP